MRSTTEWIKHINWVYALTFSLLIIGFVLTIFISANLTTQSSSVSDTDSTMNHLSELLTSLKSAQVSWGEYTLTKSYKSLSKYYDKSQQIDSLFSQIYQSSSITPDQKNRLDTLGGLLSALFDKDSIYPVLQYRKNAAQLLDSLQSMSVHNSLMVDSVTNVITNIHQKIQVDVNEKKESLHIWSVLLKIFGYAMLLAAFFLAIHMLIIYNRERKAKKIARGEAREYHRQLEERIKELTEKNKEILKLKSMEKYTALGRVATIIAHNIKNPLTSINVALVQLEEETRNEESKIYLEIIKRNSDRINDQVNHFLNVTAFIKLNTQPVSINHLLDDILLEAEDRISLRDIAVEKDYTEDICKVSVDKEKIKIALLNLIFNAIDAMKDGEGILRITTLSRQYKCVVMIEDNGSGMDEETMSKIFEPYYTTKMENGSGLGLSQTQNIILNHKGNIEVTSRIGEGTRFTVTLDFA